MISKIGGYYTATITQNTLTFNESKCPHDNGFYCSIPKRFFGREQMFACNDCWSLIKVSEMKIKE